MATSYQSGRATLLKGARAFMWEEMKTMNWKKMRAISKMALGYFRMKIIGT